MYVPQENKDLSYNFSLVGRINETGSCFPFLCIKRDVGYDVYYITANHVVVGLNFPVTLNTFDCNINGLDEVYYIPVRQYECTLVHSSVGFDLAVVKIHSDSELPVLKISHKGLHLGQPVYAMGCSLGGPPLLSNGVTTGLFNNTSYMVSAPVVIGNSGGPVFNLDGEVVGISTAIAATVEGGFTHNIIPHMHIVKSSVVISDWLSSDFYPSLLNPKK
jgi:S1-C subfamily serine protease